MGLAAEVLPVVGINTLSLVVVHVEGAPLGLEIELKELGVASHFVDQRRLDVAVRVRECAVLLVLAAVSILSTKLVFIPLYMV